MAGKQRHMFPGNNTPEGFFSYYQYILSQKEADKIFCIKGGPGVGKSTFMKKLGEELLNDGHDVDFLHCSSDNHSLDGIVLRDKKIAFIDATSPHIVDPISPGAVDTILHLGEYWNEEGIRKNKNTVLKCQADLKMLFGCAYHYLGAAGQMYHNLNDFYQRALRKEELFKLAADIINRELIHKELSAEQGEVKKYFASGITPNGCVNYLDSLLSGYKKVYLMKAPVGIGAEKLMELFAESALYRGYNVEEYYCPLHPTKKLEHLLIPDLGVAFVTSNAFHVIDESKLEGTIVTIFLENMIHENYDETQKQIKEDSALGLEENIKKAIQCLKQAKAKHDKLEQNYIPNMDFSKIEALRQEVLEEVRRR